MQRYTVRCEDIVARDATRAIQLHPADRNSPDVLVLLFVSFFALRRPGKAGPPGMLGTRTFGNETTLISSESTEIGTC